MKIIKSEKYNFSFAMNNQTFAGDPEVGIPEKVIFINRKDRPVTMSIHMNFSGMGSSGTNDTFEISGRHNYLSIAGRRYINEIENNPDDRSRVFSPVLFAGDLSALSLVGGDSSFDSTGPLANLAIVNYTFMPGQYLKINIDIRGSGSESCVISGVEV